VSVSLLVIINNSNISHWNVWNGLLPAGNVSSAKRVRGNSSLVTCTRGHFTCCRRWTVRMRRLSTICWSSTPRSRSTSAFGLSGLTSNSVSSGWSHSRTSPSWSYNWRRSKYYIISNLDQWFVHQSITRTMEEDRTLLVRLQDLANIIAQEFHQCHHIRGSNNNTMKDRQINHEYHFGLVQFILLGLHSIDIQEVPPCPAWLLRRSFPIVINRHHHASYTYTLEFCLAL
jgi:hypothetical protein